MDAIAETADTSPERAIAEVRALLGADYALVIAALATAPYEIGPLRCRQSLRGRRDPRHARRPRRPPAPPRLRVTCEAAIKLAPCSLNGCGAREGLACDGKTGAHVVRLGMAMRRKIITGGQLVEALQSALVFTGATIIRPDGDQ